MKEYGFTQYIIIISHTIEYSKCGENKMSI